MSRLPDPSNHLSAASLKLFQKLSQERGSLGDMYRTLLNHPNLTKYVSDLGSYLRFESTLDPLVREFIILYTSHQLGISYEWDKHLQPAHKAGMKEELIEQIKKSAPLASPYDIVAQTVQHALKLESIPSSLQNEILKMVSIQGLLELVILVGFYRMIAGVITCFDIKE
jgi:4-carboxymuconolactone decarboxylase